MSVSLDAVAFEANGDSVPSPPRVSAIDLRATSLVLRVDSTLERLLSSFCLSTSDWMGLRSGARSAAASWEMSAETVPCRTEPTDTSEPFGRLWLQGLLPRLAK